jgi:hypothetical protein
MSVTDSPIPNMGGAGSMRSPTARSSTDGSRNALSISGNSDTAPETSLAASGCSVVVATTSCETPSVRICANASRADVSAVITTRSGIESSLAASTSPAVGPLLRRNPKWVIHPSSKILER